MFKILAIFSLMLIGTTIWAASPSCESCGSECASACGTRHFRSCCFNYLRKKREPESNKMYNPTFDVKESQRRSKIPIFIVENIPVPDQWISNILSNENHPYLPGDIANNNIYEA